MKKVYDAMSDVLSRICFVLMIFYTVLVAIQVVSRYFFGSPTTWTELVARYLFVWSMMLYMPVLYRNHGNPTFDLVYKKLRQKTREILDLVSNLCIGFIGFEMCYWGARFCSLMGNKYMQGLGSNVRIPMNWAYCAIPVGGLFLILICIEQLIRDIEILEGKEGERC